MSVDSQSSSHGSFESSKRRWLDFVGFAKTFHVVKLPSVLETRSGESQVFNPQWGSSWECWECQIWEFDKMNVGLKEAIYAYSERRLMWHLQRSVVGTEEAFLDERWTSSQTQRSPVILFKPFKLFGQYFLKEMFSVVYNPAHKKHKLIRSGEFI